MNRFTNILFVCSGQAYDHFALDQALRLAVTNKARLSLLTTYEPLPVPTKLLMGKDKQDQINRALEDQARAALDQLIEGRPQPDQILIVPARTHLETIYAVLEHRFDLVIKAKEDVKGKAGLSSVDMRLLRKCPCPVWIFSGAEKPTFPHIVAAIDPAPTEVERVKLQYEIMKLATSLAQRENAVLDILYAWEFYAEGTLKGPRFKMSDEDINALVEEKRQTHESWLQETIEPFQNSAQRFSTHLIMGTAGEVILNFIKQNHCDLLVMGTVARTGIPGLIIGNTAETVLGQAECSMLTIKPTSFKSPVVLPTEG